MATKTKTTVNGIEFNKWDHDSPGRDMARSAFARRVAAALPRGSDVRVETSTPGTATIHIDVPEEGELGERIDLSALSAWDMTLKVYDTFVTVVVEEAD